MRRPLLALAALALAVPAVPALAADDVHGACANAGGLPVLALGGEGLTGTVATPSLVGNATESARVLLSLEGQPVARTATVASTISWDVPVNDYDLTLTGGTASATSEGFQPVDPAEESASVGKVKHCAEVVITAADFLAPVAVDTIDYAVTAR